MTNFGDILEKYESISLHQVMNSPYQKYHSVHMTLLKTNSAQIGQVVLHFYSGFTDYLFLRFNSETPRVKAVRCHPEILNSEYIIIWSNQMCTISTFLQASIPKSNVLYYFVTLDPSGYL